MKNQSVIVISLLSLSIGLCVGYGIWSGEFGERGEMSGMHQMSDGSMMSNQPLSTTQSGMHMMPDGTMMSNDGATVPEKGMEMGMGMDHMDMMVSNERDFLLGMIPHHQEAVDTAKEVLARGGSTAEVRTLATSIIAAQETEIAAMKQWYQTWYGEAYQDTGDYVAMMRDLDSLSGAALDRVFLEDMIMHHMGAIMMAKSVQPYIEHQEITVLTKEIMESQTSEITLMKNLLTQLP